MTLCSQIVKNFLACCKFVKLAVYERQIDDHVLWCKPARCFIIWFYTLLFANVMHIWKQVIQPSLLAYAGACLRQWSGEKEGPDALLDFCDWDFVTAVETWSILHMKYHCICSWSNICYVLFTDVIRLRHVSILCLCCWKPSI